MLSRADALQLALLVGLRSLQLLLELLDVRLAVGEPLVAALELLVLPAELVLRQPHVAARARASPSGARRGLAPSRCALALPPPWRPARTLVAARRPRVAPLRGAGCAFAAPLRASSRVRKLTTAQAPRAPATRPMRIPTTYGTGPPIVRPVGSDVGTDSIPSPRGRMPQIGGSGADAARESSCLRPLPNAPFVVWSALSRSLVSWW